MVVPSMAFFISEDLLIAKVRNSFFTFVHFYFTLNIKGNTSLKIQ